MDPLEILSVSSEVAPFAKTGGLADVCNALPAGLARHGERARAVMPFYGRVRKAVRAKPVPGLQSLRFEMGGKDYGASVHRTTLPGSKTEVLLVDVPDLFDGDAIYDGDRDAQRFIAFSRAVIALMQWEGRAPDILHCHDWHTALLPLFLKKAYQWDRLFEHTRTVLTIHNLGYQGVVPASHIGALGLEPIRSALHQDELAQGRFSCLLHGILYADVLTTVSKTYAREIRTPEHGMGLDRVLEARKDSLFGIVNGIDDRVWNPRTDTAIAATYDAEDRSGKVLCKKDLAKHFGLELGPTTPLFGIVSRLTPQKGFELLPDVLPVFLQREDMALVVLGSGDERHERYFAWLEDAFPGRVGFHRGYDDELAHRIEAGADAFLMPSRYEPCGLNQLYSLAYGTIPIVRRTGGLADTVIDWNPETGVGNGFVFDDFTSAALQQAMRRCLDAWKFDKGWARLQENAMAVDFSWDTQILEYVALYERLARRSSV
ncbi:MAG: glycogen synthase GlgA [Planctomycetes bacterium]|nr:glycogen synthase GlgA [Planctomycetota bacterium]